MPYTVEVPGHGVVEVPDGVSLQQAQIEIEKAFPFTGEDIAGAMQDPSFTPTKSDYLKFEEYSKTKQVDWITTAAQAADAAIGMIGGAISEGAQGAAANPLNYIEGFAQGTRQLYGLAAQSQDPSSPLFKFKDLVAGTGSPESRYNQFLDARQFGITSARLERGEEGIVVPPEYTNPEYVQGVSMILDPTLFVPGVGEILGTGKLATRAVGKGAQLTGRAVAGVARPLERFAGAAERIAAETIGTTPEALRSVASTAGIAGALGIAPEAAAFAAIPAGIRTAREAGEALARAGENLMTQPSRIGPLEAIGAAPGANMRQRMLGVIGQYGGDAAVDASLRGLAGGIEGAVIGTGLGYLSGGEEGAAAGLGSGGVQGVAGALGGRAYQKLTGEAAREARAGDLGRFIDGQQDPTTKALFERLRDTHGVDAASALMDLQGLVRGKLGDVEVEYLSNEDFTKRYKISARGVQVDDKGGRPAVVINADIIGRGKGDGPLYTLGHELFHALEKSTQLQGGATEIKNALVGRWIQEGDTIRKLSEGAFSDAEIEARFNQYRDKLGAGNASMADELAQYDTINKKADYVASELAAEHFAGLLAGQKPDALLKGFTGLTRQLVDLALTQNASRALAEAAASIERTFGVKPTDSVLFPDLKQASPQVNAMLRDLLRARRKLDEKINIQDDKTKAVLKPEDVANPLAAKQLIELGLAEQMPDGTVRAMSNDEILARENKDRDSISAIIENTPGNSRMVDGVALGRLSPNQLSAIEQSQTVSSRMKDMIRSVNATMDAGSSLNITYSAALKKVRNKLTGKQVNQYSSGIRLSDRDMLPYSFYFSKAANPVVKAIDISKVRNAILKDTASDGGVGKGLWDNVDGFMGDLAKYFTNLDQKEGARRSAEIFGLEKAKYLGDFVGAAEKGGSKLIRDFRLDRIGSMAPSGFRARFSEEAYQLSKNRWMPAEKLGDKSVINSEEGYRIISGAKHKLYSPDGKLIGIYDTQTQAERKADATQTRIQPEVRQQQRPLGDEGRQATEAGGRNRIKRGQEGQGEGGAVRQAGDVRFMPSSLTARDINAIADEVGGGDVKGGAKAFGAFMRSMRDKGITLRDVVKSYGITLSSIQRQELAVSTIKKNWPDAPFAEGTKVRPEDAFAQLLGTPEGQKYLDAAEAGVFDEQAADAVVQKFRSFGFHNKLKEQMKTAVEQFYPKAQEIIEAVNSMPTDQFIDYVRNNVKGISYGKVGFWSGQLGRGDIPTFDSRQGKLVYGKEVPVTKQVLMDQKDRLTQLGIKVPAAFKDFAQTLLHHEVWDRLNQSDTEHGPIKEAMLSFMPASDTDYLSAVRKGDTATAQQMVDEAAKAAGYTIGPVYHGTPTGGFNVFDKRMRGETSGVSRQAFSFTTDKKAAENYSKRLGDEAVRLDAGLRVANDAMRMFDEDIAAQEYFTSKGYTSVDDGMLPEFDWGSIDDVPEFIKELRGYAKDLKPINKRLSDNFIEAAKVMTSTKAVPEVKRVFLRIPEGAPVFQATPQTLGQVMSGFSAENQPTKAGIVELPGNERIYYVADSSQVKLVDAITKDDAGNVIPLSQRFKATSEDIRYMPETIQRDVGRNQDFANPPTDTEAVDALSSEKKAKFGAARSINPGTQVAARIDIPAFLRTGKYVVAVHEPDGAAGGPGKVIGYDTVTRLQNPKFVVKPGVQRIYEGKANKFPVATVDGKIMADRSIPADLENYVAVGMDPKEHAFFYDKRTDQPVIGGSESVSVGNTVFVKDPVYGKPEDFRYMPSPDSAMPGAYSFPGGYRALPGKAKGSLRLYGPAGSLLGIASSLDEAQRILRRKNK